jgi:uncharacterized membrane protein YedE/YeeE
MKTLRTTEKKYWNPYIAGVGLGLTLLTSFVIMGRGLGASGAFTSLISFAVNTISPEHVQTNSMYNAYIQNQLGHPLLDWIVFEILGVLIGGFLSGYFSGRLKFNIDKGLRISSGSRLVLAFIGGTIMGFAAKIARGCTSGQALTGGALLNVGSWIFMLSVFAGAYAIAYFVRRQWT